MNKWYEFYKDRVNSDSYHSYFEKRYAPMIKVINELNCTIIKEEGIGIGSLSKAIKLLKPDSLMCGFDINEKMIELAEANTKGIVIYQDNIHHPIKKVYSELIITHGVLEHFSDENIIKIRDRYKNTKYRVHYVPTDGYTIPSFGDERLINYEHWLNLMRPKDYLLFNDECDLLLIN